MYIKSNRIHIQFDFPLYSFDNNKITQIEGVVSNIGFRYQDNECINEFPTILLCAFKNEEKIYGAKECTYTSTKEDTPISLIRREPLNNHITMDSMQYGATNLKHRIHRYRPI